MTTFCKECGEPFKLIKDLPVIVRDGLVCDDCFSKSWKEQPQLGVDYRVILPLGSWN